MGESAASRIRFSIHGLCVNLTCQAPRLLGAIDRVLGEFRISEAPGGIGAVTGTVRAYDADEVVKHLSSTATRVRGTTDQEEIYEENERFWLIDDQWGLCEMNLLKGQFRSWVLDESSAMPDVHRIIEKAVMWPLSHLLRPRGLCMLPAASVVRDGWGAMVLCAFSVEPELRALIRAGWRVVGQGWTALREERGKIAMLPMPGMAWRSTSILRASMGSTDDLQVDLTREFAGCRADRAGLDAVLLVAPGRRPLPELRHILPTNALGSLRRDWPLAELHPNRRHGQLLARIAQQCPIFDVQLSRNPRDILALMESARYRRQAKPQVSVFVKARVHQAA